MKDEKTCPPDCSGLLRRPRLTQAAGHENRRLTVITAGPGYGKSTLMAQLFDEYEGARLWYRLDEDDLDDIRLLESLTRAVRTILAGFGAGLNFDYAATDRHHLHIAFVNGLFETGQPLGLFLEDFHVVNRSEAVMAFFQLLFNHLPDTTRVVLTAREAPALPLGRLRIQRMVNEIDGAGLRFTLSEAAALFSDNQDIDISRMASWYAETDGWPWAIALSSEMGAAAGNVERESISAPLAISARRYFQDEILGDIDDELDWFLTRSSVTRELSADACDRALYGGRAGASARMLHQAEKKNLLLPGTGSGGICRLHGWLREFFRERLAGEAEAGETEALHLGFARAAADAGSFAGAMRHYIASGYSELAAVHLEERAGEMMAAGRASVISCWLARLPMEIIGKRPVLQLLEARIALRRGDLLSAGRLLEVVRGKIDPDDEKNRSECELIASDLAGLEGDVNGSLAHARGAYELTHQPGTRSAALCRVAVRECERGRSAEAERALEKAKEAAGSSDTEAGVAAISLTAARIGFFKGRFRDVLAKTRRLCAARDVDALTLCNALAIEGEVLYLMGDYVEALSSARRAMALARRCAEKPLSWNLEGLLGKVFLALHEKRDGEAFLAVSLRKFREAGIPTPAALNDAGEMHWHAGRPKAAMSVHAEALSRSRDGGSRYHEAASLVNLGAARLKLDPVTAGRDLDEAAVLARDGRFNYLLFQAGFYLTCLALQQNRQEDAIAGLRASLSQAAGYGYDHFLVQEERRGSACLPLAVEEDIESEYLLAVCRKGGPEMAAGLLPFLDSSSAPVRKRALLLVSACGGSVALRRISKFLKHPDEEMASLAAGELERHRQTDLEAGDLLTGREQQVLGLLAAGLSNADIGARLFISEGTVKTHVGRIFGKLGISRRVQAARYFHEKGAGSVAEAAARPNL